MMTGKAVAETHLGCNFRRKYVLNYVTDSLYGGKKNLAYGQGFEGNIPTHNENHRFFGDLGGE